MEDVLEVYKRPYDPNYPVVCMDETSKQLTDEVRRPLEVKPGDPKRQDTEYVRNGVCNIFLHCEPLTGKGHTSVTEHRKKNDWAKFIKELVDVQYPQAKKVVSDIPAKL
jgi:hypothetical protein